MIEVFNTKWKKNQFGGKKVVGQVMLANLVQKKCAGDCPPCPIGALVQFAMYRIYFHSPVATSCSYMYNLVKCRVADRFQHCFTARLGSKFVK